MISELSSRQSWLGFDFVLVHKIHNTKWIVYSFICFDDKYCRFYQWAMATQWTIINCDGCRYILIFCYHEISTSLVFFCSNTRPIRRYKTKLFFSSKEFACDLSKLLKVHFSRWNIYCTFSLLFNISSCTHIKHIMKTKKK